MTFEKLQPKHRTPVMKIFNYYVRNTTAAFPLDELPEDFYDMILDLLVTLPGYGIFDNDTLIGFGFMGVYNPYSTFKKTATVNYFISSDYVNRGLGKQLLSLLEEDAKTMGFDNLIAEISTENTPSLNFHAKNGFRHCGTLVDVGFKFGRKFGIVYMQKSVAR